MKKARKAEAPPSLGELLAKVDEQFSHTKPSGVYQYTLGKFPHGWKSEAGMKQAADGADDADWD